MSEKNIAVLNGLAKLREPFPDNQIGKLPKPYAKDAQKGKCGECGGFHGLPALHVDYVGHAALTDRLLDVDPEWNWEPLAFDARGLPQLDDNGGLWIRLTVCGLQRLGYGDAQGKRGGDAIKEAIGDAIRNAGMRFGAALGLWHKGDLHVVDDAQQLDDFALAVEARKRLSVVLKERRISTDDAGSRFHLDGHGALGTSIDVEAIDALTRFYAEQGVKA